MMDCPCLRMGWNKGFVGHDEEVVSCSWLLLDFALADVCTVQEDNLSICTSPFVTSLSLREITESIFHLARVISVCSIVLPKCVNELWGEAGVNRPSSVPE